MTDHMIRTAGGGRALVRSGAISHPEPQPELVRHYQVGDPDGYARRAVDSYGWTPVGARPNDPPMASPTYLTRREHPGAATEWMTAWRQHGAPSYVEIHAGHMPPTGCPATTWLDGWLGAERLPIDAPTPLKRPSHAYIAEEL
jgi:hypothetical protein